MKRKLLTGLTVALAMSAAASPLTPGEALERALGDVPSRVAGSGARTEFRLVGTRQSEGTDAVYLFARNDAGAFLLTSADDVAPALLGYGDTPLTDADGLMSPEFSYWMDALARQVAYGAAHPTTVYNPAERPYRAPVAPLCTTKWNQRWPYNDMCPGSGYNKAVTGCVATAMSQVMKYHNWPESGEGEMSYDSREYGTLSLDFSSQHYDWDLMADSYDSDSSQAACTAVARLMKSAGYSVRMDYSASASGAAAIYVAPALGSYFKYDKNMRYLRRDFFSLLEWENMIYDNLVNCGPLVYDGQSTDGGHSFVCDGYDADGYFHINWGWGGMSDGYFLLDALDPYEQGVGGASSGFNSLQDCILGIRPDREGTSEWNPWLVIYNQLEMRVDNTDNTLEMSGTIINMGPGTITDGFIGLSFTPLDGGEQQTYLELVDGDIELTWGFSSLTFELPELAEGRYEVNAVYSLKGTDDDIRALRAPRGRLQSGLLNVTSKRKSVESIGNFLPDIEVSEWPEVVVPDAETSIPCQMQNLNKTTSVGYLQAVLLEDDLKTVVASGDIHNEILRLGKSKEFDLTAVFENKEGALETGREFWLAIVNNRPFDAEPALITEPVRVTIGEDLGVDAIDTDDADAPAVYYSIDGYRVAGTPTTPGTYIVKSGSRVSKIRLK